MVLFFVCPAGYSNERVTVSYDPDIAESIVGPQDLFYREVQYEGNRRKIADLTHRDRIRGGFVG